MQDELIVFVDEQGVPTGKTGPKLESHHAHTELHLAFSCYVFDDKNRLLVTQRAHSKKVWPGVWTNSFCGHPMPGEKLEDAIRRRAHDELGLEVAGIECILPAYRYTTPPYNGIIENEFCPVYVARAASPLVPNPDEVAAYEWLAWDEYARRLEEKQASFSYWSKDQYPLLITESAFKPYMASELS